MNTHSPSFWLAAFGIGSALLSLPVVGFPYGLHLACILIGLAVIFLKATG